MALYRDKVVNVMKSWVGKNEHDGSFKSIIDTYNSIIPLPVGYRVSYNDDWCAATYSAAFHVAGYDAICPAECSCNRMIDKARNMGIWIENDAYVPNPGDAVIYDWQDNGFGDNQGFPDHIGMVVNVSSGKITVIEGNANSAVVEKVIDINDRYIRGFVTPKFDANVAPAPAPTPSKTVKVGDIVRVKNAILYDGRPFKVYVDKYDVLEVKGDRAVIGVGSTVVAAINTANIVVVGSLIPTPAPTPNPAPDTAPSSNKIDIANSFNKAYARSYICTDNLNMRLGAGTSKAIICTLPKGTKATCYGYYTMIGAVKWLAVTASFGGKSYTGYCSMEYLA